MELQTNAEITAMLQKMNQRFSLTLDPIFKMVFGSAESTHLLGSMLNAVLGKELDRPIEDMWFLPQEYGPTGAPDERGCRMDIVAKDQTGRIYDIEMQRGYDGVYNDRLFLYVSRLVTHYTPQGDKELQLQKVIGLSFGEQALPGLEKCPSPFVIIRVETNQPGYHLRGSLPKTLHVNMPLIRALGDGKDVEDFDEQLSWCYYIAMEGTKMTAEENAKVETIIDSNIDIGKAHKRYIQSLQTDDQDLQLRMLQELNAEWRYAGELATARKLAMAEGLEEGLAKGMQEGREKGMQEGLEKGLQEGLGKGIKQGIEQGIAEGLTKGREEGHREGVLEIAKTMKTTGLDIGLIVQYTGLSEEALSSL